MPVLGPLARTSVTVAGVAALALALAACGSKPTSGGGGGSSGSSGSSSSSSSSAAAGGATSSSSSAAAGGGFTACMVLDTGGIDDHSFNQTSWAGMTAAKQQNPKISVSYVPSQSANDYTPNLSAEVSKGCSTTVAVGGLMADAVKAVAKKNPSKHFAEVDAASSGPNVYGMQFNTAQGAFLGGYLAAAYSKTGKVATWGGLAIPPVTIYMDGFWEGVQYYNQKNGKNVQVLGWSEKNQKGGSFSQSFTDKNKGKQISQTFVQQGADVLFPVAGGAGEGALSAAQASGGKVVAMWVDTDGCVSEASYCKYILTSVTKNLAGAVQQYVTQAASGTFPTGNYLGTLANRGTGLASFHDFAGKVPQSLQSQLRQVGLGIATGKIKITSPNQPK